MAKQPFAIRVPGVPRIPQAVAPAVAVPALPTAPTPLSLAKLLEALRPQHEEIERALGRLSDDLYNAAILSNPAAFALTQALQSDVTVPDVASLVKVHLNALHGPVVVILRADNDPANDVQAILVANAASNRTTARAQAHANTGLVSALLRPGQTLYVGVRALTLPAHVFYTVVPLRGREGVFE